MLICGLSVDLPAQHLLKDLNPGNENGVQSSKNIVFKGKLYFHGSDKPNNAGTIWTTDGTSEGTIALPNLSLVNNFDFMTDAGSKLFFQGFGFVKVLYVTDGTPSGTLNLIGLETMPMTQMLKLDEGRVLMLIKSNTTLTHPDQLWVSNGTLAGTFKIRDILTSSSDTYISSNFNGKALIYDFSSNSTFEPLITDGTVEGTKPLLDELLSKNVDELQSISNCYGLNDLLIVGGKTKNGAEEAILLNQQFQKIKELKAPEFNLFGRVRLYSLSGHLLIQSGSHLYSYETATGDLSRLSTFLIAATDSKILKDRFYAYFKETSGINYFAVTDGTQQGTHKIDGWQSSVISEYNIQFRGDSIYYLTETNTQIKEIYTCHIDSLTGRYFSDFGGRFRPTVMNVVNDIFVFSRNTAEEGVELYRFPMAEPSSSREEKELGSECRLVQNPVRDYVQLEFGTTIPTNGKLTLIDGNGRTIRQMNINGESRYFIPVTDLPSGWYYIKIYTTNGQESKIIFKE